MWHDSGAAAEHEEHQQQGNRDPQRPQQHPADLALLQALRTLEEEIRTDVLALEKETEGLLDEIIGGGRT